MACDDRGDIALSGPDCDDGDASVGAPKDWYKDADHDRYGDNGTSKTECDQPANYIAANGDCDDAVATVNPAALEVCDATDNDCDGDTDDDDSSVDTSTMYTWYVDADGDGYGDDDTAGIVACAYAGRASTAGDCDDGERDVNPGAYEYCENGVNDNCDGSAGSCGIDDAAVSSSTADWTIQGVSSSNWVGMEVNMLSDQDADGDDELVANYRNVSTGDITVGVYKGGVTGAKSYTTSVATFYDGSGTTTYEDFGSNFANVGDADADGYDDLAIYASDNYWWLRSGPVSTSGTWSSATTGTSTHPTVLVGDGVYAVASDWDIDGDGTEDFAFGLAGRSASTAYYGEGEIFVYTGWSSTYVYPRITLYGGKGDSTGDEIAFADFDGDSVGDLFTAPGYCTTCEAYAVLGPLTDGDISTIGTKFYGDGSFAYSGDSGADLTADGYDDVLLSDYEASSGAAEIYILPGTSSGVDWASRVTLTGDSRGYYEGVDVMIIGDTSNDGNDDIAVTAGAGNGVWIEWGPFTADADLTDGAPITLPASDAVDGMTGGDFDGDGIGDFAVSTYTYDYGAHTDAGSVFVYFGGGI